jgi:hypothetical protein
LLQISNVTDSKTAEYLNIGKGNNGKTYTTNREKLFRFIREELVVPLPQENLKDGSCEVNFLTMTRIIIVLAARKR